MLIIKERGCCKYQAYSSTGRKPAVEPRILFKVLTYAYMNNSIPAETLKRPAKEISTSCGYSEANKHRYSKTDPDATFMHMKDDHMRNAQLKPAHNVQIGVEGEYVTGVGIFQDRNDTTTLIPFLENLEKEIQGKYFQ